MAKNNKNAAKAPAAPKTNSQAKPAEVATTGVVDFNSMMENIQAGAKLHPEGLDPNHQVDLMKMMHETFRLDPNAAEKYHMAPETVASVNELTAIGQMVILANEIEYGKNPFAIRMHVHQIETINTLMRDMGIGFNMSALPAPAADGTVEVPSTAITVSEETKQTLKEEHESAEKSTVSPAEVETQEQLIDALKQIMVTRPGVYDKLNDSIAFYTAHLKLQAEKGEDKDEELKIIEGMSRAEMLNKIAEIVGPCPLVLHGMGHFMYSQLAGTKSVILAFCNLRNAVKNRTTGMPAIDDAELADYVTIMIKWAATTRINELNKRIETATADIELLSKDKKKNATAIKSAEEKIETNRKNIEHIEDVLKYVTSPDFSIVDSFISDYENKESARHNVALRMFGAIVNTYYDDICIKEMKWATVKHNVQQYAGIITNLFCRPGETSVAYAEGNLIALEPIDNVEESTEKKDDPEPKND